MDGRAFDWIREELEELDRLGLRRFRRVRKRGQAGEFLLEGREVLHFGSNDYLGLAGHPRVVAAACRAACEFGWGAGGSPLVCGYTSLHEQLEQALADFQGTEAAIVFSSGYAANVGAISSLVGPGDVVYCDEANHASIWDGCRLSRADVRFFRHGDVEHLKDQLEKRGRYRRALVVTDTVFSIDGDLARLGELVDLAEKYDAMLLVDEAHALGVFGSHGRGLVEHAELLQAVPVRVATLSKALGSLGGFVAGPKAVIELIVNKARSYIFSTALPPPAIAAALEALSLLREMSFPGKELLLRAAWLREELGRQGWQVGPSQSQILSVVVGEPEKALRLSAGLLERGVFCPAMRPPTVAKGHSCLRISLNLSHTPEMLEQLVLALDQVRTQVPV